MLIRGDEIASQIIATKKNVKKQQQVSMIETSHDGAADEGGGASSVEVLRIGDHHQKKR
jgi:hypothetical protein